MRDSEGLSPWYRKSRGEAMFKSDEVEAMLHLYALGWGLKRIASEFGCSRNTVRRYVAADGWVAYSRPRRGGKLAGLDAWLRERFVRHGGNAEVVRQDLRRELSVEVSLRTVERAVTPYRRLLAAEAKATLRFETPPARQLQVDFGEVRAEVAGARVRVYLLVATLGYSRRGYVEAFEHARQSSWFRGLEGAFRHFGGVTEEVLVDNARALVVRHDSAPAPPTKTRTGPQGNWGADRASAARRSTTENRSRAIGSEHEQQDQDRGKRGSHRDDANGESGG